MAEIDRVRLQSAEAEDFRLYHQCVPRRQEHNRFCKGLMRAWVDGYMDGWMGGEWTDGWMDGQTGGWTASGVLVTTVLTAN